MGVFGEVVGGVDVGKAADLQGLAVDFAEMLVGVGDVAVEDLVVFFGEADVVGAAMLWIRRKSRVRRKAVGSMRTSYCPAMLRPTAQ